MSTCSGDNNNNNDIDNDEKYMLFVNLLRMLAHARFVYVRMSLLSVTLDEEEGCVQVGQVEHPLDVSDDDDDDE